MTRVCAPITVESIEGVTAALADAGEARLAGADLVEYRLDSMFTGEEPGEIDAAVRLADQTPLPCIMTCRPTWEGGEYDGEDTARIALFERLGTADRPPAYIDVELAAYTRSANLRQKVNLAVDHPKQERQVATRLILSTHDFEGRPADLTRRLADAYAEPAVSVVKVAFRARSLRDNLELFEILRGAPKPTIALGMGEFGLMSRVLAPKFGGFLTFASLRSETTTAPGQPTIAELLGLYRFASIGRATKVYGIVGWPVGHSLSPVVHNAGFDGAGCDGVYVPMPIVAGDDADLGYAIFRATVGALLDEASLDLAGLSVTLPHKQNLGRMGADKGWQVDVAGGSAANTLARRDGALSVHDTDAPAVVSLVGSAIGSLAGCRVCIAGTGGVARSIASRLMAEGATGALRSRDEARAAAMVAELARGASAAGNAVVAGDPINEAASVFINCSPVGMEGGPAPEGMAFPVDQMTEIGPDTVFFDTVYRPRETPMLRAAAARGCRTIDGTAMFVAQAEAQFAIWTGRPPAAGLFARIVDESLSG